MCYDAKADAILLRVWSIAECHTDAVQPVQTGALVQQSVPAETQDRLRQSHRRLVLLLSL